MRRFIILFLSVVFVLLCGCNNNLIDKEIEFFDLGVSISFKCDKSWYVGTEDNTIILAENADSLKSGEWYSIISVTKATEDYKDAETYLKKVYASQKEGFVFNTVSNELCFTEYNGTHPNGTPNNWYLSVCYDKNFDIAVACRFMPSEINRDLAIELSKSISIKNIK